MKLNISERITINALLPAKGDMLKMELVKLIKDQTKLTKDEMLQINIKQNGANITWDSDKDFEKDIKLDKLSHQMLLDQITELDKKQEITEQTLPLARKIKDLVI